jgi:predicted CXXCH cytochrome family protein
MSRASDPKIRDIPLPPGLSRNDVSYIIGGYKWKALFLDRNGYLITESTTGKGENQFNLRSRTWTDYRAGQKVSYDCGGCHTTGFTPEGHQNGLEGIIGTWKFEGVQCEACHGPGGRHATSALKEDIKVDRQVCSGCHGVKPLDVIPAEGIFISPYTEVNQLMKSTMKDLTCVGCHNPHPPAHESIKQTCESCHQEVAGVYAQSYMHKVGVTCTDCHMPAASLLADSNPTRYEGDLKSHLFRIDYLKPFPNVASNGKRINPGYLTVDYSCMKCHDIFETRPWAVSHASIAHRIKTTTNLKIMRLQMGLAYLGMFFAVLSLWSALSMKKWLWPAWDLKRMASFHRQVAWITFALFVFESTLCVYFHFPLAELAKAANLGWFLIHPINGVAGIVLYAGKVLAVRKFKKGWAVPGMALGLALSAFWVLQFLTAALPFYEIVKL